MSKLLSQWRTFWLARNARERRMLSIMSVVLGIGLLLALYDWQASERSRLEALVPNAQAQLQAMQDDATELASLRAKAPPPVVDAQRRLADLQSLATAQGLTLSLRAEGDQIVLSGQGVSFDAWVNWLGQAVSSQQIRLQSLDAKRGGAGINIDARLSPAR